MTSGWVYIGDIRAIVDPRDKGIINLVEKDDKALFWFEILPPSNECNDRNGEWTWFSIHRDHPSGKIDHVEGLLNVEAVKTLQFRSGKPTKSATNSVPL